MTDEPSESPPATVCPRCSVGCRLRPGASRSRARGVAGPANPNGRLCPKGIGAFEVVDEDDRLTRPLLRRGGEHRPVPWTTAYDHVVERFEAILAAHGPDALAFLGAPHCTTEENFLLQKLARVLGTNNVDNRARLCHVSTTRALSERFGWPATTNGLDDLGDADAILVAGANPAERQPVAFNAFVRPAVADGATLVHVDPVGNRTTRLADIHLAPRPGTDALVFDLLSAGVLERDSVDRAFVDRRTRGSEAFAAVLSERDPEHAIEVADVDSGALDRVVDLVADADRVAAMVGTGIEGSAGDPNAAEALLDLLLLTGNVGRRGTGLFVLRGLVNEQGATDAGCVPDRLPGHRPVTDPEARARVADEWGVEPPATPGKTAHDLLAAFGDEVRGALVVGENPAISKRDPEWLRERFDALDVLVVVDLVPSETTPHADVVLPAAAGVEKEGTVTNLDRRIQRLRATSEPPGEARPDFEILRDLGRRLVDADRFDYDGVREAFDELTRVAPSYAGVADADLDDGPRWPVDRDILYRESFDTPDGRAPFGSPRPVAEAEPADGEEGDGLRLVTGGRASDAGDTSVEPVLRLHPADAADRGIDSGVSVVVSNGDARVEATADLDEGVRRGTVYLPATVADPLLRGEIETVSVESRATGDGPT